MTIATTELNSLYSRLGTKPRIAQDIGRVALFETYQKFGEFGYPVNCRDIERNPQMPCSPVPNRPITLISPSHASL